MLEQASLLVHAWTQKAEPDGRGLAWIRPVTDGAGRPLGFVRLDGDPRGSWFSWFRKVRLDIFETDDVSHLMSMTRSWGMLRIWEVDDAEDRHVGTVYAHSIVSSEGERLAWIERESPERGHLLDSAGELLATFGKKVAGVVEVTFASPPNPFLRMLVLGCALALEPGPNR
jgi:hypothetical protein